MNYTISHLEDQPHIELLLRREHEFGRTRAGCELDSFLQWSGSFASEPKHEDTYGTWTMPWAQYHPDELRTGLIGLFARFVDSLTKPLASTGLTLGSKREAELQWLEENKSLVEALSGNWVAIEGKELITSSVDFSAVLQETKKRGIGTPFIVFIPKHIKRDTVSM